MPDDIDCDPLPSHLDLIEVIAEALTLEMPDYPTHPDAQFQPHTVSAPGVRPMTDDDAKPFAKLAELKGTWKSDADGI